MIQADWPFGDLTPMKYGVILCDPPWRTELRSPKGYRKSPEAHYDTMTEAELAKLPVNHLAAKDCVLVMWTTAPQLAQSMRLIDAWGFQYKTAGSWVKLTKHGKIAFGTGYIFRSACEFYLVATVGAPEIKDNSIRNVILSERREHSRKPDEMRIQIERMFPNVWACDLFARQPWPGHDVWGNETTKFAGASE